MTGIHGDRGSAGVVILAQYLLPTLAAVDRSVDAAFGVRPVGMAENGRKYPVRLAGIDGQARDLLTIPQTEPTPRPSGVIRAVHPIADRQVRAMKTFTTAHIDYVWVGRSNGDRADRLGWLIVEQGLPGTTGVVGPPDTAVNGADIEDIGLCRHARDRARPAAAVGADHSPFE